MGDAALLKKLLTLLVKPRLAAKKDCLHNRRIFGRKYAVKNLLKKMPDLV